MLKNTPLQGFHRPVEDGGALWCEDVPLTRIAESVGTPVYVYSRAMIEERFKRYSDAFDARPHLVCYAVKANSAVAILEALARLGAGFDTVSWGEILRVVAAGADPKRIVFSGVGKSRREIALALLANIRCFNVESAEELDRLEEVAARLNRKAPIALRVNPDVDPHVDRRIATGVGSSKFGIDKSDVLEIYEQAAKLPHIEILGISCHIGSQLQSVDPYLEMIDVLAELISELAHRGIAVRQIDLGGGAGVAYRAGEETLDPSSLIAAMLARLDEKLPKNNLEVLVEPGRSITAQAGVLLTRVEFLKRVHSGARYAIVDAAMTDFMRPALYGAWHEIERVVPELEKRPAGAPDQEKLSIAGPVCESTDVFARDRSISAADDDLLVFRTTGAYGMSMASNYNSRPLPFEVLIDGSRVIPLQRRRQSPIDLIDLEAPLEGPDAPAPGRDRAVGLCHKTEDVAAAFFRSADSQKKIAPSR